MGPREESASASASASSPTSGGHDQLVPVTVPYDTLYRSLEADNAYFDSLVDLVPARLYIGGHTGDEAYNPKYKKGQAKESKESRRARNKVARRRKFHPTTAETTLEAKRRKAREEEEDDDDSDDEDEDEEGGTGTGTGTGRKGRKAREGGRSKAGSWTGDEVEGKEGAAAAAADPTSPPSSLSPLPEGGSDRIEALRARLRAKIAAKAAGHGGRLGGGGASSAMGSSPDAVSKRAARRAEKVRRIEEAKRRAGKTGSTRVGESGSGAARRVTMPSRDLGGSVVNAGRSEGEGGAGGGISGVDFGGIAGLIRPGGHQDNRSLALKGKKKSLDRLLAEAEKKRDRLRELRGGTEEDKEKLRRIQWGDTLREATGERVRDDPALIKKAMRRKAKAKAKSARAWESRVDKVDEAKRERQKIRSHNLTQRVKGGTDGANLSRKRINDQEDKDKAEAKQTKRMRSGPYSGKEGRAGFEGKKTGFINDAKGKPKAGGGKAQ